MTSDRKDIKMRRETADRHLREVTCRIREVNSDQRYCYSITEAYVFGSFVNTDDELISDLDIAVRLEPRCEIHSERYRRKQSECPFSGDYMWLVWPREEVLRFIRHSSSYVSIHVLGDSEQDALIFSDKVMEIGVSGEAIREESE